MSSWSGWEWEEAVAKGSFRVMPTVLCVFHLLTTLPEEIPFFKVFYWGIVDLQGCDSFCCTTKCLYMYTYLVSFQILFSHRLTQYWAEFSVLYSKSPLGNHSMYSSVYMPVPNPQSISLLFPICTLGNYVFKVCVSVSFLQISLFISFFLRFHI